MTNDNEKPNKEIDKVTGVETTGHEWDGLKELNNPLPRWWVWVWIATILWSLWYFVVYPAWPIPGGATEGTSGYTQYKELAQSQQEIVARQSAYLERFEGASFDTIMNDPELYAFATFTLVTYFVHSDHVLLVINLNKFYNFKKMIKLVVIYYKAIIMQIIVRDQKIQD